MNNQQLIEYVDQRIGDHTGAWPEFQWFCPFCLDRVGNESTQRKLRLNATAGKAICFRCGYACDGWEKLLRDINGGKLLSNEAELLAGEVRLPEAGGSIRDELLVRFYAAGERNDRKLRPVPLPKEYIALAGQEKRVIFRQAFRYLTLPRPKGRAIPADQLPALLTKHRIGYCLCGEYANRIVFPVHQSGKQVYFTTRYCGDHFMKARNPKNAPGRYTKEDVLLGYDNAIGQETVVIVEGGFDMTAFDAAVGLLGKRISDNQLKLLETLAEQGTQEFVVGLDPDACKDAHETTRKLTGRLPKVTFLPITGGDPDEQRAKIPEFMALRRPMGVRDVLRNLRAKLPQRQALRYGSVQRA